MKKLLALTLALLLTGQAHGVERKAFEQVVLDDLIKETQVTMADGSDQHFAMVWWMPLEFWQTSLAKDPSTSPLVRELVTRTLEDVTLLAVVQADLSRLGAFTFYPAAEVREQLTITFVDGNGRRTTLQPLEEYSEDLASMIETMQPMLESVVGRLGENMHFFVLDNRLQDGGRLIDPYQQGMLEFGARTRDERPLSATIEMPLNGLFVPRICPNGKEAHVSWVYCPWSGSKLPQ